MAVVGGVNLGEWSKDPVVATISAPPTTQSVSPSLVLTAGRFFVMLGPFNRTGYDNPVTSYRCLIYLDRVLVSELSGSSNIFYLANGEGDASDPAANFARPGDVFLSDLPGPFTNRWGVVLETRNVSGQPIDLTQIGYLPGQPDPGQAPQPTSVVVQGLSASSTTSSPQGEATATTTTGPWRYLQSELSDTDLLTKAQPEYDDSTWASGDLPAHDYDFYKDSPGNIPWDDYSILWLRRSYPASTDGYLLRFGNVDDEVRVYLNGVYVGMDSNGSGGRPTPDTIQIPATLVVGTGPQLLSLRGRTDIGLPNITAPINQSGDAAYLDLVEITFDPVPVPVREVIKVSRVSFDL